MAANVLSSERAVEASVQVVRAFVRLRLLVASNEELTRRLDTLEEKVDANFQVVFEVIEELNTPIDAPIGKIGFLGTAKKK